MLLKKSQDDGQAQECLMERGREGFHNILPFK